MQQYITRRLCAIVLVPLVLVAVLLHPPAASAHPLGNFTVNRYSRLELSRAQVTIVYVVDMAEIPTFQELERIDMDRDGRVSDAERDRYGANQVNTLGQHVQLRVNGVPVALTAQDRQLVFADGQGGLQTLRLSVRFVAALAAADAWQLDYRDDNFAGRIGWREVVVRAADDVTLLQSSAPANDISQELRSYPRDLLQSPPEISSATLRFQPVGADQASSSNIQSQDHPSSIVYRPSSDRLAALISAPTLGPAALLIALATAFALGAAHALSPGHGKTIVAAYLVGARGTARHALFLGITTTITHTAGVFGLGIMTLFVSEFILPEQLYPWLGVISGLLVLTIGASLFRGRLQRLAQLRDGDHHHHDHTHAHAHDHHHDDHTHRHDHNHGSFTHTHDGHTHTHLPPGADGTPVTWRSLLALGISGGLLPCPSALVVLLGAIALGKVGLGLLLITAFSLGLASVLTSIGVLLVHARRVFRRLPTSGRVLGVLPVISALIITLAGLGITAQALLQTGLL